MNGYGAIGKMAPQATRVPLAECTTSVCPTAGSGKALLELLADEASEEEVQPIRRRHLEDCLGQLERSKRELLLKVHSPGVIMREVALQSGKSEQAFYKFIQRLRAVVLTCVTKAVAAENA